MRSLLQRKLGHEVFETTDGLKAWEVLDSGMAADLCILDMWMPRMSSLHLVSRLRSDPRFQRQKVILCSAENRRSEILKAASLGISGYLIKPFGAEEFLKQVRKACEIGMTPPGERGVGTNRDRARTSRHRKKNLFGTAGCLHEGCGKLHRGIAKTVHRHEPRGNGNAIERPARGGLQSGRNRPRGSNPAAGKNGAGPGVFSPPVLFRIAANGEWAGDSGIGGHGRPGTIREHAAGTEAGAGACAQSHIRRQSAQWHGNRGGGRWRNGWKLSWL